VRAPLLLAAVTVVAACGPGSRWVAETPEEGPRRPSQGGWLGEPGPEGTAGGAAPSAAGPATGTGPATAEAAGAVPLVVQEHGDAAVKLAGDVFRNTYYDFPREKEGTKDAKLFDARCETIAMVPTAFHDQLCVQGSGRLASGATVSFAKRDCSCAAVCPRTGQKICFERLDPAKFPHGRGAMGTAITPLRTIAVDPAVIPLGTVVFIPSYVGMARPDGSRHDGCFVAEDRGIKVVGKQIDLFTGDPDVTSKWNVMVPSNQGVAVRVADPRCKRLISGAR
jgi:3D (Asp-Asp-Asp) domain-containing protein